MLTTTNTTKVNANISMRIDTLWVEQPFNAQMPFRNGKSMIQPVKSFIHLFHHIPIKQLWPCKNKNKIPYISLAFTTVFPNCLNEPKILEKYMV